MLIGTPGTAFTPAFQSEDCGNNFIRVGYADLVNRFCTSELGHCEVGECCGKRTCLNTGPDGEAMTLPDGWVENRI